MCGLRRIVLTAAIILFMACFMGAVSLATLLPGSPFVCALWTTYMQIEPSVDSIARLIASAMLQRPLSFRLAMRLFCLPGETSKWPYVFL